MSDNKCYRCDKIQVSSAYKSQSTREVIKGRLPNSIVIPIHRNIKSCIGCISPESRPRLHKENVFKRYEYTFINSILDKVGQMPKIKTVDVNSVNRDGTRYDLLLADATAVNTPKFVILIEIDEKQHFTKSGWFDGKLREKVFEKYYNGSTKRYILRIRVSEDSRDTCVIKKNTVSVSDCAKFDTNMKSVSDYIRKMIDGKTGGKNHFYIDFADTIGVTPSNEEVIKYATGKDESALKKVQKTWDSRLKTDKDGYITKIDIKKMLSEVNRKFADPGKPKINKHKSAPNLKIEPPTKRKVRA